MWFDSVLQLSMKTYPLSKGKHNIGVQIKYLNLWITYILALYETYIGILTKYNSPNQDENLRSKFRTTITYRISIFKPLYIITHNPHSQAGCRSEKQWQQAHSVSPHLSVNTKGGDAHSQWIFEDTPIYKSLPLPTITTK